jgi:hypothetical protein
MKVLIWFVATGSLICQELQGLTYANPLTNQSSISTQFTYVSVSGTGSFQANPSFGLELTSTAPNSLLAAYILNQRISSEVAWSATVKAHISAFYSGQSNAAYVAGLSVFRDTGSSTFDFPDRANFYLVRGSLNGDPANFENGIAGQVFTNNSSSQAGSFSVGQLEDYYLRWVYTPSTRVLGAFSSPDGLNFSLLGEADLSSSWNLTGSSSLGIALLANSTPSTGPTTASVTSGQIYLRDLNVVPEPSTYALLLLGGAASLFALRRRKD